MTGPGPLAAARPVPRLRAPGPGYKWIALSNTTLGVLMASINASVLLIALPDIFRGIGLNPLQPGNSSLLLWLIMGYMVVTAVLVVSFGRLGDMYGRVRMYNLGFAIFTVFSVVLSVTWMHGTAGALWLIIMRVFQGVGGAMLMANSAAILTDAFPTDQRGLALGLNQVAGIAGSFIGLILGGLLGPVEWHLVFLVSVPFGLFGTVWAYLKLRELAERRPVNLDWWGNLTFGAGLIAVLTGITYGIEPYGGHTMGWTDPWVIAAMAGGVALLAAFCFIETRVAHPMFRMELFRIRAFTAGNLAGLLSGLGRGGLMFILIIWLQGIYLPRHGYDFARTPLWAGIYMLPLTAGFLLAGPVSGWLSDHFGARPFATGGMVVAAGSFWLLETLPVNFVYWQFALILLLNGIGMGLFASPNRAAIMNSLPPERRGAGSGMASTFQNSSMVLSIGIFFTLIILGLAATLPAAMLHGLTAQGVPTADAARVAALPPVSVLFASLLGYNPVQTLLGPVLSHLAPARAAYLTGRGFFPSLITPSFGHGLSVAFDFAIAACLVAAVASLLRGGRYIHGEQADDTTAEPGPPVSPADGTAASAAGTPRAGAYAGPPATGAGRQPQRRDPTEERIRLAERSDSVAGRLPRSGGVGPQPREATPSRFAAPDHLDDGRLATVLRRAADRIGWDRRDRQPGGPGAGPNSGHGLGLACGSEKGSRVATAAEVRVDDDGTLHVLRLVTAFDCGAVVDPANLASQVEDATVMGLGGALFEQVDFADDVIRNASLSTYRVPRLPDVPPVEAILIDRPDQPNPADRRGPRAGQRHPGRRHPDPLPAARARRKGQPRVTAVTTDAAAGPRDERAMKEPERMVISRGPFSSRGRAVASSLSTGDTPGGRFSWTFPSRGKSS